MALTEAEIQTQWKDAIDVLETLRAHVDGTICPSGGKLDTLFQALEGTYLPSDLTRFGQVIRSGLSNLISPTVAQAVINPVLYEYAQILAADASGGYGSSYRTPADIFRALYEWFVSSSATVQSRTITYDTSVTAGGSNVGNGALGRLTVDENGFNLEACNVEKKQFRCRADQNTGASKNAEVFELSGTAASPDNCLRSSYGSGDVNRSALVSLNAGTGPGGSLLTNSSFSTYNASATPKFAGWTETNGGSKLAQDTSNYYRTFPNASTDASLKITGDGTHVTITQTLSAMRTRTIDPNTPYVLRVMLNKTVGTAVGGTVTISMGGTSKAITIASLGAGWQELIIDFDANCWPRVFGQADLSVVIDWTSSSSGYLLVDDVIFAPWTKIDGTFWHIRGNAATHTPWLVDDVLTVTDTGGAPATGKLQWWLFVAGYGYLPSSGTPTVADP